MTEEEAKTKWCPFARIADGQPEVAVNRPEPYGDVPKCLGSFCMAWRATWSMHSKNIETGVVSPHPVGYYDARIEEPHDVRSGGYCGLAGEP